jgi:hypothetical protein
MRTEDIKFDSTMLVAVILFIAFIEWFSREIENRYPIARENHRDNYLNKVKQGKQDIQNCHKIKTNRFKQSA